MIPSRGLDVVMTIVFPYFVPSSVNPIRKHPGNTKLKLVVTIPAGTSIIKQMVHVYY